jgi:hypothetical protein
MSMAFLASARRNFQNQEVTMAKKEWTNELTVPEEIDREMAKPTPRETKVAGLAEKYKDAKPVAYTVKSKNPKALRVIHDHQGNQVALTPGEEKQNVMLLPHIADYLNRLDLEVTAA